MTGSPRTSLLMRAGRSGQQRPAHVPRGEGDSGAPQESASQGRSKPESLTVQLPRPFVLSALAVVYVLAFVISPYWTLVPGTVSKVALLVLILIAGIVWCTLAAGEPHVSFRTRSPFFLATLIACVLILNLKALRSGLPWRGDEDQHIHNTLLLVQRVPIGGVIGFGILVIVLLVVGWHRSRWTMPVAAALVGLAVLLGWWVAALLQPESGIPRYPSLNYWIFMLVPKLGSLLVNPHHEMLYRLVPLAAMALMAGIFGRGIAGLGEPAALLWGFSIATVPLVLYYSSILYLEQIASLLMFIMSLQVGNLLPAGYEQLRREPAWYALVLIGFIKETTLLFLLCFIICNMAVRACRRPLRPVLTDELKLVIATCLPVGLYLLLRSFLAPARTFEPVLAALLNHQVYRAIAQSYVEQFGLLLVLFAAGCIMLVRRRQLATVIFYALVALTQGFVYAIDYGGAFAGYSRFNLLVLPVILAGASIPLIRVAPRMRRAAQLAPLFLIAGNLLMSPINSDGSKVPFWGNYLSDTSEHYYPFREAFISLQQTPPGRVILIGRIDRSYDFDFYFHQLDWYPRLEVMSAGITRGLAFERMSFQGWEWHPRRNTEHLTEQAASEGESASASSVLKSAGEREIKIVIYQVLGSRVPQVTDLYGFQLQQVVSNQAHSLMIFTRAQ